MQDIINQFIGAMSKYGCEPHDSADVVPDGKSHYYRLAGDKKDKRGGYRFTIESDGFAFGNFCNFKTGDKGKWNSSFGIKGLSQEEKDAINKHIKELEAKQREEDKKLHEESAVAAKKLWDSCEIAKTHPYLSRKGIKPNGARIDGKDLILRGMSNGKIWSYQRITPDGAKYNLENAKKQGTYYPLTTAEEAKDTILIAEGFSTSASIREATNLPTICAWDSGNLLPVSLEIRKKYPQSTIILCADNDCETIIRGKLINIGVLNSTQAAAKVNGIVVYPELENGKKCDWNDYHQLFGLDAVKDKILAAVNAAGVGGDVIPPKDDSQIIPHDNIPTFEPDDLIPFDVSTVAANLSPAFDDEKINSSLIWKKFPTKLSDGKKMPNMLHNILVFMRHKSHYRELFRYDRFAGRLLLYKEPFYHGFTKEPFKIREINNTDISYIKAKMEVEDLSPSEGNVFNAINTVAHENWINPPYDYFNDLKWDGIERLRSWLVTYLGADGDNDYLSAVGMCWLIAAIARIFNPGSKAENMLVLEGAQGLLKSTALKTLASIGNGYDEESYFCDTLTFSRIQEKDTVLITKGKLIIEFAELANLGKREVEEVKTWMSITHDEIRRPYDRNTEKFPRQFILAGSTNELQWLKDQTGNRRFWPVRCTKIDIKALKRDREQIWAEAVHLFKSGTDWWIDKNSPVNAKVELEQNMRLLGDIWQNPIEDFVSYKNFVTINDILLHFKIDIAHMGDKDYQNRVGKILRSIGFEPSTNWDKSTKKNIRGWKRKKAIEEKIIEPEFEEIGF